MLGEGDKKVVNHKLEASDSQAFNIQACNIPGGFIAPVNPWKTWPNVAFENIC